MTNEYPKTTVFTHLFKVTKIVEESATRTVLFMTDVARERFGLAPLFDQIFSTVDEARQFAAGATWPSEEQSTDVSLNEASVAAALARLIRDAYMAGVMEGLTYSAVLIATSEDHPLPLKDIVKEQLARKEKFMTDHDQGAT